MRKSKLFFLILLVLCFNTTVFSQDAPNRIISLGPSLTEELYLLGAEGKIIGCTTYCKCPKEKVGNVIEVNVEKILSLKPDLVLATSLTNQRDIEKLRSLGVNVITFKTPRNFSEICEAIFEIGKDSKKRTKGKRNNKAGKYGN
ncbi:MAG: Vitamin B12-binding protein [Candidatus Methanoperedenaceae archaeon GB37]|nr:Vitamin B12-binding protein [Candidatus Methanoperedenaceae archaeon GB37]CAD7783626.1 MAG: Vitamin B12-binding protein [Candidatus Methanoperedenaceae archaeon GB37]